MIDSAFRWMDRSGGSRERGEWGEWGRGEGGVRSLL